NLDKTKARVVAVFADKLGIKAEPAAEHQAFAAVRKLSRAGNDLFRQVRHKRLASQLAPIGSRCSCKHAPQPDDVFCWNPLGPGDYNVGPRHYADTVRLTQAGGVWQGYFT